MFDPFKIDGPAVISFSGGRTSAYMLWRILQSHGGTLPDDVKVMFANTGKEMEETLEFVNECSIRWGVPITWVEYRPRPTMEDPKEHAIVSFETASRNGEPFNWIVQERRMLPNPRARFCRTELKYRTMHRVIEEQFGFEEWTAVIGMRADEPDRVAKLVIRDDPREEKIAPLATAGIAVQHISEFWKRQPFDLRLPNMNGKTMHGNCDLCFLKAGDQLLSLIREQPARAVWWMEKEMWARKWRDEGVIDGNGDRFRLDRPSVTRMLDYVRQQDTMFVFGDEAIYDCGCTD